MLNPPSWTPPAMLCRSHKTASVSRPLASLRFAHLVPTSFYLVKVRVLWFQYFQVCCYFPLFTFFFLILTIKKHYCFPTTKSVDISTEIYLSTPPPQLPDYDPCFLISSCNGLTKITLGKIFQKFCVAGLESSSVALIAWCAPTVSPCQPSATVVYFSVKGEALKSSWAQWNTLNYNEINS